MNIKNIFKRKERQAVVEQTIQLVKVNLIKPKRINTIDLKENEANIFIVEELDGRFSAFKVIRSPLDKLVIVWFLSFFDSYTSGFVAKEKERTKYVSFEAVRYKISTSWRN